jgi:hypothetical protein
LARKKRNEMLIHGLTWINLENVMLSEKVSHKIQFHLCEMLRISK